MFAVLLVVGMFMLSGAGVTLNPGDIWVHPPPLDVTAKIISVGSDVELGIRINGGNFLLVRANNDELQNWLINNRFHRQVQAIPLPPR